MTATYTTEAVADLFGVSTWSLYESVRNDTPPVKPIRVGRRIVWPKARVDSLLGLTPNDEGRPSEGRPSVTTNPTPSVTTTERSRHEPT